MALASLIAGAAVLDLDGFHRVVLVTAVFFVAGGVVSLIGIQNPSKAGKPAAGAPAAPSAGSAPASSNAAPDAPAPDAGAAPSR